MTDEKENIDKADEINVGMAEIRLAKDMEHPRHKVDLEKDKVDLEKHHTNDRDAQRDTPDTTRNPEATPHVCLIPPFWVTKYTREAGRAWDRFYTRNGTRFFRDRHWPHAAFAWAWATAPGAAGDGGGGRVWLEAGCGVGNTLWPMLAAQRLGVARVYACDVSPEALRLLRAAYEAGVAAGAYGGAAGRAVPLHAFRWDLVGDASPPPPPEGMPAGVGHVATLLFVLSALRPEDHPRALRALATRLAPGARLCFRDYARGDGAAGRFADDRRMDVPGLFVRQDGTLAYFFGVAEVRDVFARAGFRVLLGADGRDSLEVVARETCNRKTGVTLPRRFIQGIFEYVGEDVALASE